MPPRRGKEPAQPTTTPASPINKYRHLERALVSTRPQKEWEQGFPIDVRPIKYAPAAGDRAGQPTGAWQVVMNPTARFNVKPAKATAEKPVFNNNVELQRTLQASRLGKDIKCRCVKAREPPCLSADCVPALLHRFNPSENGMCLKISGHVQQVLNIVEDCKTINNLGPLVQFSGIPEEFAHKDKPPFKCYTNELTVYCEGINTVPLYHFLIQLGFKEEYPGLYLQVCEEEHISKVYEDVQGLAATWGFVVE